MQQVIPIFYPDWIKTSHSNKNEVSEKQAYNYTKKTEKKKTPQLKPSLTAQMDHLKVGQQGCENTEWYFSLFLLLYTTKYTELRI